jgi:FAM91 N-terminus
VRAAQAADILQIVGIGRNEYISIMNQCKAKKLLWRVNKALAKEFLPQEPLDVQMEPWWIVHVVNLGARRLHVCAASQLDRNPKGLAREANAGVSRRPVRESRKSRSVGPSSAGSQLGGCA